MKISEKHGTTTMVFILRIVSGAIHAQAALSTKKNITTFFSIVHPVVTFSDGNSQFNFDGIYAVGFPTGVNFVQSERIAFSIELVPSIEVVDNNSRMSGLLFHPGVIYRNIGGFNFLTRLAFNTNGRFGFTLVANKPIIDQGFIIARNASIFARLPCLSSAFRVNAPANSGTKTYSTTDNNKVSQGTVISVTPSNKPAIGAKANIIMISLIDTCTNV